MALEWFIASPKALLWVLLSTVGIYLAALVFARLAGVRSFAEMSAFDVAVTIAVGSVMATTVVAKTPSLIEGVFALLTLYVLQIGVSRWRSRVGAVEQAVDNRPILLMGEGGRMLETNMRIARITEDDLRRQLRKANIVDYSQIQAVVMEGTGGVNVLHGHGSPIPNRAWILENVRDYSNAGSD